jgi:hypothetical protein
MGPVVPVGGGADVSVRTGRRDACEKLVAAVPNALCAGQNRPQVGCRASLMCSGWQVGAGFGEVSAAAAGPVV